MIDESRIKVYDYVYDMLYGRVSENVYPMYQSQELTESDKEDGFIVIRVGNINDDSEFDCEAFGWCRVFVEAFVPPMSRGRLDEDKYSAFESGISTAIKEEIKYGESEHYSIQSDGILSFDDYDDSNANNIFYKYIKSFIVIIQ